MHGCVIVLIRCKGYSPGTQRPNCREAILTACSVGGLRVGPMSRNATAAILQGQISEWHHAERRVLRQVETPGDAPGVSGIGRVNVAESRRPSHPPANASDRAHAAQQGQAHPGGGGKWHYRKGRGTCKTALQIIAERISNEILNTRDRICETEAEFTTDNIGAII